MKGEIDGICLCDRARRLSRNLSNLYEEELQASGISTSQYTTLRNIARKAPLLLSDLAQEVGLDQSTMTRSLATLQNLQLIEINRGSKDGRTKFVELTSRGLKQLKKSHAAWRIAQAKATKMLDPELTKQLAKL